MTALIIGLLASIVFGTMALPWLIRRRLGGYRHEFVRPDPSEPLTKPCLRRVAVIGGGVAGLAAALTLARRGYAVTVFEKKSYLGGKLGSSRQPVFGDDSALISHGFHAFFPHYHNFERFLHSFASCETEAIEDYVICEKGGQMTRFGRAHRTPVLNLLSLMIGGLFSPRDAFSAPGRDLYGVFLEYDAQETFRRYDEISYAEFARLGRVPPRLKLAFNTFARAFFADEEKLSLAQLIKAFHFYYLSHDGGLLYRYPVADYDSGLMRPLSEELVRLRADLRLGDPVTSFEAQEGTYLVNGRAFEAVVLASDPLGLKSIAEKATGLPEKLTERLRGVKTGQRYAVLRLWLDRDIREDIPIFVITEREKALDAVTAFHRFETETREDLARGKADHRTRSVLELHCYAVPDDLPDQDVKPTLLRELMLRFPELEGATVLHEWLALEQDFTAFHVGLEAERPGTETGLRGLFCAGDWVRLPFPAMLLEAAAASGYLAANAILEEDGLRKEPITTVPLRGLMAGLAPTRARLKVLGA